MMATSISSSARAGTIPRPIAGNFTLDADAFPSTTTGVNTAVAIAYDFNHDGYPDLFVGGRSVPREYGATPSSCLFVNDGQGHFKDIAPTKNPDIAGIGMVTGAVWADVTGDTAKELIITGEWMPPRIFSFNKDHFEEVRTNLSNLYGWWESIAVEDLNGDGKPDLILGNIGDNFYLHPDSADPVKLWLNDFDRNGIIDKVLTRSVNGKDMPVFLKHEMERQLPLLKKQNLKHGEYALKSIRDLLPSSTLDSAAVRKFNYCHSIVAINRGNGQFTIRLLPAMAQLSSVNAIQCLDLNGDGIPDLVLGGNEFGFLPQFGRLDAGKGNVLLGDGKGGFTWIPSSRSGLELRGQIRDIRVIPAKDHDQATKEHNQLLFLQNDEYPSLYRQQIIRNNPHP
jgi:hypothetical protein